MLSPGQKQLLLLSFLPYLVLSAYDGWLHEKARRVPRFEQGLHGVLAISVIALATGLFLDRPWLVLPAVAVFAIAGLADELGFHGSLTMRERRLHHVAYACYAGFVGVAVAMGAVIWPWP